ncbi:MAG: septum formation protein Maf [Candidatus Fonsibacter ubiquis]|nr:septum formation protein Maf [Candidatus Fonsibacter ubiquis]
MNETKHSFVLASASPRRIELLKNIKIFPKITYPSEINEDIISKENPRKYCIRIAKNKALKALEKYPEEFILSADTIVFCSNKIFLKPKNKEEAKKFLAFFSGRKHNVLTCVCLAKKNLIKVKKVFTKVTFKRLNTQEIEEYLLTNEWKDKAGAYAIQGYAEKFIKRINGSYSNVVGLPLFETYNLLNSQGLI